MAYRVLVLVADPSRETAYDRNSILMPHSQWPPGSSPDDRPAFPNAPLERGPSALAAAQKLGNGHKNTPPAATTFLKQLPLLTGTPGSPTADGSVTEYEIFKAIKIRSSMVEVGHLPHVSRWDLPNFLVSHTNE